MKWFDRWFYRKAKWAWENRDIPDDIVGAKHPSIKGLVLAEEPDVWSDGLRINVKKMIGGYVVSFRISDRVRDRSDDRDQRHKRSDRLALAVARGDEVGDRRDVLALGEPHDPQHERRAQSDHQDRTDIDGQEVEARL